MNFVNANLVEIVSYLVRENEETSLSSKKKVTTFSLTFDFLVPREQKPSRPRAYDPTEKQEFQPYPLWNNVVLTLYGRCTCWLKPLYEYNDGYEHR